jgi:hypothetical protein
MTPGGILTAYRFVFSVLIVVASMQTLLGTPAHHVVLLAAAEVLGALLLLRRRLQWLGVSLLLSVFSCAQLISAAAGSYPTHFAQYAASALLIVSMDRVLTRAGTPRCGEAAAHGHSSHRAGDRGPPT